MPIRRREVENKEMKGAPCHIPFCSSAAVTVWMIAIKMKYPPTFHVSIHCVEDDHIKSFSFPDNLKKMTPTFRSLNIFYSLVQSAAKMKSVEICCTVQWNTERERENPVPKIQRSEYAVSDVLFPEPPPYDEWTSRVNNHTFFSHTHTHRLDSQVGRPVDG